MKKKDPKIYKSYPEILSIFVAIFISGILLAENFSSELYIFWLGLAVGSFALHFFVASEKVKVISLLVAALTASLFYGAVRMKPEVDFHDLLIIDNTSGTLNGRYTGKSSLGHNNSIVYVFKDVTYQIEDQTVDLPGEVNCKAIVNRQRLYPEQYYSMEGDLHLVNFDKSPLFKVNCFENVEAKLPNAFTLAKQIQQKIKSGLTAVLKEEHANIVTGFILGDTSQIKDKNLFSETGISHLLAISGQHIMIIILLIASILHWLKIPPLSRSVLIAIILTFYAMITVGSPSVWRALIMYISVAVIMHLESESSPIRPLSIAAFIMLLYDPSLITNAAFVLSFTAVLSIIFLRHPFEYILAKTHLPDVLNRYLAVTFAANLGTMPMVAYLFGSLSISALFVNPLILWTFTFILPTAFFIAFLSILSIPFAVLLSPGLSILLDYFLSFLESVKEIPGMYFYVGNISPLAVVCFYAFILYLTALFNNYQLRKVETILAKREISKIPIKTLPKAKEVEIHIDKGSSATPTLIGIPDNPVILRVTAEKHIKPFKNSEIISAMDEMLCSLKRLPGNALGKAQEVISVNNLSIDGQNLYYKLFGMNETHFIQEPERLLQSHAIMLAICGYELLNRISSNLNPPLTAEELSVDQRIQDKYLALAILSDSIMNAFIVERAVDPMLAKHLEEGKILFEKANSLLEFILSNKDFNKAVAEHMSQRIEFMKWIQAFIQRDNIIKQERRRNVRNGKTY